MRLGPMLAVQKALTALVGANEHLRELCADGVLDARPDMSSFRGVALVHGPMTVQIVDAERIDGEAVSGSIEIFTVMDGPGRVLAGRIVEALHRCLHGAELSFDPGEGECVDCRVTSKALDLADDGASGIGAVSYRVLATRSDD